MAKSWPDKDPDDVADYGFNWTPKGLGTDTITATSAVVVTPDSSNVQVGQHSVGIVDGADDKQGTVTWLSGGVDNTTATIRLRITTSSGRQFDQTMTIRIASN